MSVEIDPPSSHERLQRAARDHLLAHGSAPEQDLLVLDRGEGPYVFDTRGNRYLDGVSSLFCAQLGYSYGAEMADAARAQLERLAFGASGAAAHPAAIELAERLAALAPDGLTKVFFTGSGTEAIEAAYKLVRLHFLAAGEPQRRKAIARQSAYHGATLGALALTGIAPLKAPFGPPAIPVRHVSNTTAYRRSERPHELLQGYLAEMEAVILAEGPETVAMVIAEPVQSCGGCLVPPPGYWVGLRELCDRYGILLVADEVVTGCGRLGEWFGVTRVGGHPDVITLAKGLASAYAPIGAVLATEDVAAPLADGAPALTHETTFGGHPLSAAIALRNVELFERDAVLENVRANTPHLQARMRELLSLPIVGDVRGDGYFWAAELVSDGHEARFDDAERDRLIHEFLPARLRAAGLIARADDRADAVVQLAPPLIAGRAVLDDMVDRLGEVLDDAGRFVGV